MSDFTNSPGAGCTTGTDGVVVGDWMLENTFAIFKLITGSL
jgi:hypothetical protein